jgi:hypothetical protein
MAEHKDLAKAREHLHPDENIVQWSNGLCESKMLGQDTKRNGIVVATNKRVFIFVNKMFGYDLEEFPFATMSSIEYGKGMIGHKVKFVASGNSMQISMMSLGDPIALVDYVRKQIGVKQESPSPQAVSEPDLLTKLERLADLHTKGMLTAEEFQQAKARLLS